MPESLIRMEVNTGRAGFAFIRIRDRPSADRAVEALHHREYAPKYKMNVSIGKPPHEYKKQKNTIKRNKINEGPKLSKKAKKRSLQRAVRQAQNRSQPRPNDGSVKVECVIVPLSPLISY